MGGSISGDRAAKLAPLVVLQATVDQQEINISTSGRAYPMEGCMRTAIRWKAPRNR